MYINQLMATLNIKNYSHPLHYVNVAIGLYSTSCHSPQYSLHVSSVNPFTSICLYLLSLFPLLSLFLSPSPSLPLHLSLPPFLPLSFSLSLSLSLSLSPPLSLPPSLPPTLPPSLPPSLQTVDAIK